MELYMPQKLSFIFIISFILNSWAADVAIKSGSETNNFRKIHIKKIDVRDFKKLSSKNVKELIYKIVVYNPGTVAKEGLVSCPLNLISNKLHNPLRATVTSAKKTIVPAQIDDLDNNGVISLGDEIVIYSKIMPGINFFYVWSTKKNNINFIKALRTMAYRFTPNISQLTLTTRGCCKS